MINLGSTTATTITITTTKNNNKKKHRKTATMTPATTNTRRRLFTELFTEALQQQHCIIALHCNHHHHFVFRLLLIIVHTKARVRRYQQLNPSKMSYLAHLPSLVRAFSCHPSHTSSRSEEHTSELQSLAYLVCRLLLEKKKQIKRTYS